MLDNQMLQNALKNALVIGSSGGIGSAFVEHLTADSNYGHVLGLHRASDPSIDFAVEASLEKAAAQVKTFGPFDLIINAAGVLHSTVFQPEKKLAQINMQQLLDTFTANTFGPALVLKHFSNLLTPNGKLIFISAKVGSIGDNHLGGWYSYRASKAALNMLVKTASIELARKQPNAIVLALHPGTVQSRLSQPFKGLEIGQEPAAAAHSMIKVITGLTAKDSGKFLSYQGSELPW